MLTVRRVTNRREVIIVIVKTGHSEYLKRVSTIRCCNFSLWTFEEVDTYHWNLSTITVDLTRSINTGTIVKNTQTTACITTDIVIKSITQIRIRPGSYISTVQREVTSINHSITIEGSIVQYVFSRKRECTCLNL